MQRLFSAFPGGWPGTGLLLLRVVLGIAAATQGTCYLAGGGGSQPRPLVLGIALLAAGLALIIGFLTPVAGGLAALITGGLALTWVPFPDRSVIDCRLAAILTASISAALALLGPGALSLDSKLFGPREIIIPPASHRKL